MIVGCPKEIKEQEYRVGMTPGCVNAYVKAGHRVLVQASAGEGAGFADEDYSAAGAEVVDRVEDLFAAADMIVKVKEPLPQEYDLFREGHILFTYLHLAADEELTRALLERKLKAVAYETIETAGRQLPCLRPMSEIAGRLSIQEGAKYLEKPFGGRGVLLGGIPGVQKGRVIILGAGVVGISACKVAVGMGAEVTLLDLNMDKLYYAEGHFGDSVNTLYSNEQNIRDCIAQADLVIGAVLIPGAATPKLIRREHLAIMQKNAVIVDVAVDQGGCFATTRPTTHHDPTYVVDDVLHYCVGNMPGAVPRTSTLGLTNTTLSYGLEIAGKGVERACLENPALRKGLNLYMGNCTYEAVADAFGMEYTPVEKALEA